MTRELSRRANAYGIVYLHGQAYAAPLHLAGREVLVRWPGRPETSIQVTVPATGAVHTARRLAP